MAVIRRIITASLRPDGAWPRAGSTAPSGPPARRCPAPDQSAPGDRGTSPASPHRRRRAQATLPADAGTHRPIPGHHAGWTGITPDPSRRGESRRPRAGALLAAIGAQLCGRCGAPEPSSLTAGCAIRDRTRRSARAAARVQTPYALADRRDTGRRPDDAVRSSDEGPHRNPDRARCPHASAAACPPTARTCAAPCFYARPLPASLTSRP